jgi:adenylate cyclase
MGEAQTMRMLVFLFGVQRSGAIPARVQRVISSQQAASEIIVGLMQCGAIVFFATVYAVTPKAFPPSVAFEPIPWTLGIYALFTALRLVLAWREQLTRGLVALSVVVDITVLMITIWSFHLQYQAPPALYLKAPTMMYVFVLIALRTLRFEPAYVVLAGASAALGWLILFLYAALFSARPTWRCSSRAAMSNTSPHTRSCAVPRSTRSCRSWQSPGCSPSLSSAPAICSSARFRKP